MGNRSKGKTEPDGAASPENNGKFSLISDEKLLALYKNLLKCRMAAKRAGNSNGTFKAARDREAGLVATAIDLGPGDVVFSREHGWLSGLSDGATIDRLLVASGENEQPSPGTSAPIAETAIGTALANKTKKNGKVAVMFSTDSPDTLCETVEIAGIHGLPMVFVHQANGKLNGNVRTPRSRRRPSPGEAPWFPSIMVDTHDVVAVYRVANEAISRARQGRGPTLIECRPFWLEGSPAAVGSGRNGRHTHDAIANMEHYLRARGLFDRRMKTSTLAELRSR